MSTAIDTSVIDKLGYAQKTEKKGPETELGEDAFLTLVIAQLQNQDPLKPMENGEFLSQLAQFKSVSGIDEMKKAVETMAGAFQSNQALQASSLVGRWVMVESNSTQLWQDVGMAGSVDINRPSSEVRVNIYDNTGRVVHQIELGHQDVGSVDFSWDGVGADGTQHSPGEYRIEALARVGDDYESMVTNTIVPVDSVIMGKTGQGLTINAAGVGKIKLSDVKQIM